MLLNSKQHNITKPTFRANRPHQSQFKIYVLIFKRSLYEGYWKGGTSNKRRENLEMFAFKLDYFES